MRITSRNVNGIRAVLGKGFYERVKKDNPDILCIQETKAFETQLPPDFHYHMQDYNMARHAGQKPWYSWVVTFYKKNLKLISSTSRFENIEYFHEDGRVVETKFEFENVPLDKGGVGGFVLLNVYFPNGGERADGTEMLDYKLEFYHHFLHYINNLRKKWEHIITCWDFNVCHREIDIARPEENKNSIWFLPIERAELDKLEKNDYVDVFRHFHPDAKDHYTRRSYRAGARPRNVWRRLDYFRVSKDIISKVQKIIHQTSVEWSDHCPISIELE